MNSLSWFWYKIISCLFFVCSLSFAQSKIMSLIPDEIDAQSNEINETHDELSLLDALKSSFKLINSNISQFV